MAATAAATVAAAATAAANVVAAMAAVAGSERCPGKALPGPEVDGI